MAGIITSFDFRGVKKVERLRSGTGVVFSRFSVSEGRNAFNKYSGAWLDELHKYPPKRPGQRYIRTFRLRRGWKLRARNVKNGVIITSENRVEYTHFVVGKPDFRLASGGKDQAWMHEGRWWLAGGVAKKYMNKIQVEYEKNMLDRLEEQTGFAIKRRSRLLG